MIAGACASLRYFLFKELEGSSFGQSFISIKVHRLCYSHTYTYVYEAS